ncbi:unnamed protein product [Trichogramma brassicae]|uniref:Uncharacterized protein n=1 Tax=Trichogramma brassicae TaxID=86971 RepID=A0A6H5J426_9HYME|nr:unnamed protein product [Trichogramma brassicae]
MKSEARTTLTRGRRMREPRLSWNALMAPLKTRTTTSQEDTSQDVADRANWGTCHRRKKREPHSQDGTRQRVLRKMSNSGGDASNVCRRAWVRSPLGEFSRFVFSPGVVEPVPEVERYHSKRRPGLCHQPPKRNSQKNLPFPGSKKPGFFYRCYTPAAVWKVSIGYDLWQHTHTIVNLMVNDENDDILTYERAQIVHLPQKLCRNSGYILRAREGLGAIRLSSSSVCGAHVTLYRDFILYRFVLNCAASPMRSVICNRD